MGWHDDTGSRTGGYKGSRSKPSYGWNSASDGRKHDLIGYSEVRNAKSYSSETQQVVEVRRGGAIGADYGSPQIHDGSKRRNQHRLLAPWLAAAPELHEMGREDSPKPVHMMAHSGGSKDNNPPRSSRHSVRNPHAHGPYRDSSDEEDDDNDDDEYNSDDSDSDRESVFSQRSRGHGYPKAQERPNGHNHTQVNPSVPITTYYETKPLAAGPPRIKSGAAPDFFRKKSPPQAAASAPVGAYLQPQYNGPSQRKGKGHQGAETRRRYRGGEMPAEQYNGPIDCREAAERFNGVFLSGNKF